MKKKRLEQMVAARSQLNEAKARQEKQEEMNHMVSHALKDFEKERNIREPCCMCLRSRLLFIDSNRFNDQIHSS